MDYFFYPVSANEYRLHPELAGWDACLKHESEWVQCNEAADYISVGYVKGGDVFVYKDTLYFIHRVIMDISKKRIIVHGIESKNGYDVTDPSTLMTNYAPKSSATMIKTEIDKSGIALTTEVPYEKKTP